MDERMKAQFIREINRANSREDLGMTERVRSMGQGANRALECVLLAGGYVPVYVENYTRCSDIVPIDDAE